MPCSLPPAPPSPTLPSSGRVLVGALVVALFMVEERHVPGVPPRVLKVCRDLLASSLVVIFPVFLPSWQRVNNGILALFPRRRPRPRITLLT